MDTSEVIDDILEHFGTKGMRWGVRKRTESSNAGLKRTNVRETFTNPKQTYKQYKSQTFLGKRKAAKEEKKFQKTLSDPMQRAKLQIEIHNRASEKLNAGLIDKLNNEPKWRKAIDSGTLRDESHPTTKAYFDAHMNLYVRELNNAASTMGNYSGTKQLAAKRNENDFLGFTVYAKDVKHADESLFRIEFIKDEQGRIVGVKLVDNVLVQGESAVDDILIHFGVKGMKWGVRRKATVGPQEVFVRGSKVPGSRRLVTKGGKGHPSTSEAVKAREIGQIGKKSGLHALSDEQLRQYSNRIQLEQNVARLQYNEKTRGARFVDQFLGRQGSRLANEASKQGATYAGKKALNKATRRSAKLAFAVATA